MDKSSIDRSSLNKPSIDRISLEPSNSSVPHKSSVHDESDPDLWLDAYGDALFRYALLRLENAADAEEAVQETLLAAIRNRQQFDAVGSRRSWLLGILKRKIADHLRVQLQGLPESQHSVEQVEDAFFSEDGQWQSHVLADIPIEQLEERSSLWRVVRLCLDKLPAAQSSVFVLRFMEEMQAEQICDALNITRDNFYVRLHRARLNLAKCVGSSWNREELYE